MNDRMNFIPAKTIISSYATGESWFGNWYYEKLDEQFPGLKRKYINQIPRIGERSK